MAASSSSLLSLGSDYYASFAAHLQLLQQQQQVRISHAMHQHDDEGGRPWTLGVHGAIHVHTYINKLIYTYTPQRLNPPSGAMGALFLLHRGLGSEEEAASPEEREEALLFYHPGIYMRRRCCSITQVYIYMYIYYIYIYICRYTIYTYIYTYICVCLSVCLSVCVLFWWIGERAGGRGGVAVLSPRWVWMKAWWFVRVRV